MTRQVNSIHDDSGLRRAQQLAQEAGLPEEHVVAAYLAEIQRIRQDATCRSFVDLLALKHIRSRFLDEWGHREVRLQSSADPSAT